MEQNMEQVKVSTLNFHLKCFLYEVWKGALLTFIFIYNDRLQFPSNILDFTKEFYVKKRLTDRQKLIEITGKILKRYCTLAWCMN